MTLSEACGPHCIDGHCCDGSRGPVTDAHTEADRVERALKALGSPGLIEPSCEQCFNVCYPTEPCTCPGCWPVQKFAADGSAEPVVPEESGG